MTDINTNALFLGPKAENSQVFEELILEAIKAQIQWRRDFHPEDALLFTQDDKNQDSYKYSVETIKSNFHELISRLNQSLPFHSPRYIGHMLSDILMPAMLGYFTAMLYNPNNVSYEASPVTSQIEVEVAKELAQLAGFKHDKSWGHLTGGGTVANIEALWVIRNLRYFPLIASDLAKKFSKDIEITLPNKGKKSILDIKSEFELLSLSPKGLYKLTADFFNIDWGCDIQKEVYKHHRNISHAGMGSIPVGKVLIPSSKHYSWPKAMEILGLGRSNIEHLKVDSHFRTDMGYLKEKLAEFFEKKIPVLASIGIVGNTECGAIDSVDEIVALRKWYEQNYNSSFFIHVDAAYGGYARSIFINENGEFKSYEEVKKTFDFISQDVYEAYSAINKVDSITIDPHKLGYIPYPAGAVIFKDRSVKPATMCKAPYINVKSDSDNEAQFGEYILEGSKPGAAAAACWLAHKILPLNEYGYGKVISSQIQNANVLYDLLKEKKPFVIEKNGQKFEINIELINKPDLDIILYVFNIKGNSSLEKMNDLNKKILEEFTFNSQKNVGNHDYLISSTEFYYDIYGESLFSALDNLGIDHKDWTDKVKSIKILRSSIELPITDKQEQLNKYWRGFVESLEQALKKVI